MNRDLATNDDDFIQHPYNNNKEQSHDIPKH